MSRNLNAQELQNIVDHSPLGIIVINNAGTIEWANKNMCNILHCAESELVDKSIETVDSQLTGLFTDGTTLHLTANKKHDDIWLINVAHKVADNPEMGIIHYLSDVSSLHNLAIQHEDLKSDFEDVNTTDHITGLPNRRAMYQTLEPQVSRSRRYDNPLSIIIMKLDNLNSVKSNYGGSITNKMMVEISQMLNDQLRWADTIGKLEDDEFIFVLPETNSEDSKNLITKVKDRLSDIFVDNNNLPNIIKTQFGSASWEKGDDVGLLMRRARERMAS
ncbi:MAG: diguanylate cyclase domain-containing protein [Thiohalomonadales bacterium]